MVIDSTRRQFASEISEIRPLLFSNIGLIERDEARRGGAGRGETTHHGHEATSRVRVLGHLAHLYACLTLSDFPKMPFFLLVL